MSNLFHAGLNRSLAKCSPSSGLLCLCKNKGMPGNFQNETVNSKFFFKKSAQERGGLLEVDKKHRFIL